MSHVTTSDQKACQAHVLGRALPTLSMLFLLLNLLPSLLYATAIEYSETPAKFITSDKGITTVSLAPFWLDYSTSRYPSIALPLISSSSDLREYHKSVTKAGFPIVGGFTEGVKAAFKDSSLIRPVMNLFASLQVPIGAFPTLMKLHSGFDTLEFMLDDCESSERGSKGWQDVKDQVIQSINILAVISNSFRLSIVLKCNADSRWTSRSTENSAEVIRSGSTRL
jgi:hypothetical protein